VFDPVDLERTGSRRAPAMSKQPGGGEVAFLPQISTQHPDVEILRLDAAEPMIETPNGHIDGNGLVIIGRCAGCDGAGVRAVLPEQRTNPAPVAAGQPLRVTAEQMLDAVLVATAAGGGTIFNAAPGDCQDAEVEREKPGAAQADWRATSLPSRGPWLSRILRRHRSS
jgi:hypothetical protein